jgi:hypothetical protein
LFLALFQVKIKLLAISVKINEMIRQKTIKEDDGSGEYSIFESVDVEYVNPIQHFSTGIIAVNFGLRSAMILDKNLPPGITREMVERRLMAEAAESWNKFHTKIANTPVTENFLSIFNARTKKEQIKLLKNLSLTPDQLLAFIFTAYSEFGYLFSEYVGERNHKGFDPNAVPAVFGLENGSVHKIGPTSLTDGQLKQVIEQRKVIVSKFLDKGEQWHCLFLTEYREKV